MQVDRPQPSVELRLDAGWLPVRRCWRCTCRSRWVGCRRRSPRPTSTASSRRAPTGFPSAATRPRRRWCLGCRRSPRAATSDGPARPRGTRRRRAWSRSSWPRRDGTFAPLGADVVDVPAGGVRVGRPDQGAARRAGSDPVSVRRSRSRPGPACVLRTSGLSSVTCSSSPPPRRWRSRRSSPTTGTTEDLATRLVLTAPDGRDVRVRSPASPAVATWSAGRVDLAAGTTRRVTVSRPRPGQPTDSGSFGDPTPPGDGPVYGVRMLDEEGPRGPLVTSLPLRTARLHAWCPGGGPGHRRRRRLRATSAAPAGVDVVRRTARAARPACSATTSRTSVLAARDGRSARSLAPAAGETTMRAGWSRDAGTAAPSGTGRPVRLPSTAGVGTSCDHDLEVTESCRAAPDPDGARVRAAPGDRAGRSGRTDLMASGRCGGTSRTSDRRRRPSRPRCRREAGRRPVGSQRRRLGHAPPA